MIQKKKRKKTQKEQQSEFEKVVFAHLHTYIGIYAADVRPPAKIQSTQQLC